MTVKDLIAELSKYDSNAEIISIEVDDWQWKVCNNDWRLRCEWLDNAKIIMLNPE